MKVWKKALTGFLAGCLMLSMTACSDTTWVFDYDGEKIPSGVYLEMTMEAYDSAADHEDIDSEITDMFQQTLDGKNAKQWIIDEARKLADNYIAIQHKFDELGLTLSEEDLDTINAGVEMVWKSYSELYEKNGVGKNSYQLALTNGTKMQKVFDKYYAEGGLEEVSEADLKEYYNENFVNVNVFTVSLSTGDDLTDEQKADNEARLASVDEYVTTLNNGSQTFNEVRDAYYHTYMSQLFGETHDENSTTTYDSAIQEDSETIALVKKDSADYPAEVVEAMFNLTVGGDVKAIESDGVYYIVKRYSNADTFAEMKGSILSDMKAADFEALLAEWRADLNPTVNTAAVNKYDPKNITFE